MHLSQHGCSLGPALRLQPFTQPTSASAADHGLRCCLLTMLSVVPRTALNGCAQLVKIELRSVRQVGSVFSVICMHVFTTMYHAVLYPCVVHRQGTGGCVRAGESRDASTCGRCPVGLSFARGTPTTRQGLGVEIVTVTRGKGESATTRKIAPLADNVADMSTTRGVGRLPLPSYKKRRTTKIPGCKIRTRWCPRCCLRCYTPA